MKILFVVVGLMILSGVASGSDKITCRVTRDWHDDFGNYDRVEVCDFSNGDRLVTSCTSKGCDVDRTTAAERRAAEERSPECPNDCAGLFKMLPIPDAPDEPVKKSQAKAKDPEKQREKEKATQQKKATSGQ